jgi:hypothetical protein
MKTQINDTNKNTEKVLIALLQKAKPARKFAQIRSLSHTTLLLSRRAIARKNPDLNENQLSVLFIRYHYGKELADRFQEYLTRSRHD